MHFPADYILAPSQRSTPFQVQQGRSERGRVAGQQSAPTPDETLIDYQGVTSPLQKEKLQAMHDLLATVCADSEDVGDLWVGDADACAPALIGSII